MLQYESRPSWIRQLDAFSTLPTDMAEATATGATMTMVALLTCAILFACEVSAFLTVTDETTIIMDTNQDHMLRINFDVHMLDMACDHVVVGVWDAFGTERMNVTQDIMKQRIDHKGQHKGRPYTEDEVAELESIGYSEQELAELDADWLSSSDQFKHEDFEAVVNAHAFTIINFYAEWCSHCRQFAPAWSTFEDSVNSGKSEMLSAEHMKGVRALKMNCVDFEATCRKLRVRSFPTIRLFRRGHANDEWREYGGSRDVEGLTRFLRAEMMKYQTPQKHVEYHDIFNEGCRIYGSMEVARVPGTVHIEAVHSKEKTLNVASTNVSHTVNHFSFGEAPRKSIFSLPAEYKRHVNPLDGRTFIADKLHSAPHHFIKVVHTRFEQTGLRSYQQTHQWNVRPTKRKAPPQAKFSYDLAPVEVVVSRGGRRWYDFVTSCMAIVGGAFSVMSTMSGGLTWLVSQIGASGDKAQSARRRG